MFSYKTFCLFLLFGTYSQALEGSANAPSKTEGIVSPKSRIEIVVPGFTGAKVEIKDFEGTASYNVDDITETEYYVKMNLKTADAGIKSPFMKSEMFLDAAHYPYASFRATHNEAIDKYSIHMYGNLTMKGITRPIVPRT